MKLGGVGVKGDGTQVKVLLSVLAFVGLKITLAPGLALLSVSCLPLCEQ